MIRRNRLTLTLLDLWLVNQAVEHTHPNYRLRVWRENRDCLAAICNELITYFDEAHDDARRRIRRGFEDDLSPFDDPAVDPAANYPARLHRATLQGYLGETLAVIAVEHWGAHGHRDWVVPAFLFRFHDQEFQHLEVINERILAGEDHDPDCRAELRPGRTGDDGLAFRINGENIITDILTLEAKCLLRNNTAKIEEAHTKLSTRSIRPSGVREIINILEEYDTPEANAWQEALLNFWRGGYRTAIRHDAVGYACGCIPSRSGRIAWMPNAAPHPAYTAHRNLEGMEFQFEDLITIVNTLYRGS